MEVVIYKVNVFVMSVQSTWTWSTPIQGMMESYPELINPSNVTEMHFRSKCIEHHPLY